MNKLAIFFAAIMIAGAYSQIADCLLNDTATTGTKCLLCASGKRVADGGLTCTAAMTGCAFSAGMTPSSISWCDVCTDGKMQTPDGMCVTATGAATATQTGSCAFIVPDGALWSCIGCKAGNYTSIDKTTGCSNATAPTAGAALWGTWKACGPNQNSDAANAVCSSNTPAYTGNEQSSSMRLYWTTSTTTNIKIATDGTTTLSTTGFNANCWFLNNDNACVKCKPNMVPKWMAVGTTAPKALNVECLAYTAPTGTNTACRAWFMNGTVNTCATCSNINMSLSAPVNNTCFTAPAANNTTNTTTNASIIGFSAILLLVVSRLF